MSDKVRIDDGWQWIEPETFAYGKFCPTSWRRLTQDSLKTSSARVRARALISERGLSSSSAVMDCIWRETSISNLVNTMTIGTVWWANHQVFDWKNLWWLTLSPEFKEALVTYLEYPTCSIRNLNAKPELGSYSNVVYLKRRDEAHQMAWTLSFSSAAWPRTWRNFSTVSRLLISPGSNPLESWTTNSGFWEEVIFLLMSQTPRSRSEMVCYPNGVIVDRTKEHSDLTL